MTELDFDELDKAVNNLMSEVDDKSEGTAKPADKSAEPAKPQTAPAQPANDPVVIVPNTASKPDEATAVTVSSDKPTTDTVPAEQTPQADVADTSPAAKRRGQFMDMVHPSSDMKNKAPAMPSRQGVNIQPPEGATAPEPKAPAAQPAPTEPGASVVLPDTPAMPDAEPATGGVGNEATDAATPMKDEPEKAASEWPDPIDMQSNADTSADESAKPVEKPEEASGEKTDEPNKEEAKTPEELEPLSSPFLPDAKVDKRPLGGAAPVAVAPKEEASTDATVADKPAEAEKKLPDELKTDVMALESTDTKPSDGQTDTSADKPEADNKSTDKPVEKKADSAKPDVPGGGSIAQQYKEKQSDDNTTNSPIYDAANMHQPAGAQKGSHAWLKWVIGVLVLIVLAVLGGAGYFYLTTQM